VKEKQRERKGEREKKKDKERKRKRETKKENERKGERGKDCTYAYWKEQARELLNVLCHFIIPHNTRIHAANAAYSTALKPP